MGRYFTVSVYIYLQPSRERARLECYHEIVGSSTCLSPTGPCGPGGDVKLGMGTGWVQRCKVKLSW